MPSLTPADKSLAAAIRRLRDERGQTQEAIAIAAGLTLSSFGRIERGQIGPAWTTVRNIAEAFDLSLIELAEAVEREEG